MSFTIGSGRRPPRSRITSFPKFKRTKRARGSFIPRSPRTVVIVQRKGELKFLDTAAVVNTTNVWTTDSSSMFNPIKSLLGNGRVGIKVKLMQVHVKAFISIVNSEGQAAPNNDILTRIIIGINHQGGNTTAADVMDTLATTDLLSWRKLDRAGDFTIIKDWYMHIRPNILNEGAVNAFATGASTSDVVKWSHTWKNGLPISFTTGADTVARNNIFLLGVANNAGGTLNLEARFRYTDS